MAIPNNIVDELMVKCGRRCCICRRFDPLHLHVHHIVEQAEGGTDEIDNLIPVCLTCHSDVHTHTKLTRRFTANELKGHKAVLIEMVANGTLLPIDKEKDNADILIDNLMAILLEKKVNIEIDEGIPPHAVKLLIDAVKGDGTVCDMSDVLTSGTTIDDIRSTGEIKDAIDNLESNGLMAYMTGIVYRVTHKGFLLADKIIALADEKSL